MRDKIVDNQFEINRPHDTGKLYKYFIDYKFKKAISKFLVPLKNLRILDICCGSGMISEYYAKNGAIVTGIDMSEEAIDRAKLRSQKYGFEADFRVGDSTNLPFDDNSFDIVSVHDGLHHIGEPKVAVKEMARVAKKAVVIIEPARAIITEVAILLGISQRYEGPDYVYRFKRKEFKSWLKEFGFNDIKINRYIMFYPHKPGRVFKLLGGALMFSIVKFIFCTINMVLGSLGNKVQIIGFK